MNALKNIFLIGSGIAAGALVTLWVDFGTTKPAPPPTSTQAKPSIERDEREMNDMFLDDDELIEKNAERDTTNAINQSRRWWENPDDPSIGRNYERKNREFWGHGPGHY